MLNPSRTVVILIAAVAFVGVFLGLNTDVGLFGWSGGVLLGLYLTAVGIARLARRHAV
jgi:hypothetical protein